MHSSPTGNGQPVQAGIYCRISLAGTGDFTKTDDQERICQEVARRLTWHVAEVYTDHARSAWQPNRKRPAWDKMLADIDAGRINAIVVYHGDRLLRTHEDLLKLINLSRARGIKLASPAGERDLGSADDQFILEIEASMAKRESANTSRRRKQQYDRWRREGKVRPGGRGGRAFGFATDGITHIPAETVIICEAAARVLAGEPVGAICRMLNARGVLTPAGNPLSHQTLRKLLARPRYAGLMPDGVSPAAWEPVLDRETWEATVAALTSKAAGFGYTTNARKYLLSGLAVCGACGSPLQIRAEHRRTHQSGYGCIKPGCRKVQRSVRLLDAYVVRRTVNRLNHAGNPDGQIPAAPGLASQFAALTTARAEAEAALRDPSRPGVDALRDRLGAIDGRLAELRELAAGDAAARLRGQYAGITDEEFNGLPLTVRRALVAACWTVTVLPASRRGPGFRTEDVQMSPRP